MNAHHIGERDGWTCWLCGHRVDPYAPAGSPSAPTVDHVVPRSRGGSNDEANLRLAHRRCNGRRGNHLPELDWPDDLALLDAPPLWRSLRHLIPSQPGRRARRRSRRRKTATTEATGVADCHVVRLTVDGPTLDPGRPVD